MFLHLYLCEEPLFTVCSLSLLTQCHRVFEFMFDNSVIKTSNFVLLSNRNHSLCIKFLLSLDNCTCIG